MPNYLHREESRLRNVVKVCSILKMTFLDTQRPLPRLFQRILTRITDLLQDVTAVIAPQLAILYKTQRVHRAFKKVQAGTEKKGTERIALTIPVSFSHLNPPKYF